MTDSFWDLHTLAVPPVEILKAVAQFVTVAVGVFLGWWLNGLIQRRVRLTEVRGEWAAAVEECVASIAAATAPSGGIVYDPSGHEPRSRAVFERAGKLRAATARLSLLEHDPADIKVIEAIERDVTHIGNVDVLAWHPTRDGTATAVDLSKTRAKLRSLLFKWRTKSKVFVQLLRYRRRPPGM